MPADRDGTSYRESRLLRKEPVRWWVFVLVPFIAAGVVGLLLLAGAGVGSVLVLVYVYSFALMIPVGLYLGVRALWRRLRR